MAVNIKPLEDKILVQANEAETTTASGLVIPDTAKEKPQEGEVVLPGYEVFYQSVIAEPVWVVVKIWLLRAHSVSLRSHQRLKGSRRKR